MKSPEAGASLRLQVPPDPSYSRYVRERVVAFVAGCHVPEADGADFVIAVSEALANAIEHSRSRDTIDVSCWVVGGDQLLATVVDRGIGFEAATPTAEPRLPDPLAERGRGLPIMRRCTDVFAVRSAPGQGTAVTLGRYVRRPGGQTAIS